MFFSLSFFRHVLQAAPDALLVANPSGKIIFVNDRTKSLFGYSSEELCGKSIELLFPRCEHGQSGLGGGASFCGCNLHPSSIRIARSKSGLEFPADVSLSFVGEGERKAVVVAVRDFSAYWHRERDLAVARDVAERAYRSKNRALLNAAQDLRPPLQILALLNESLRHGTTDPERGEMLAQQRRTIEWMSRRLDAVLGVGESNVDTVDVEPRGAAMPDDLLEEYFE